MADDLNHVRKHGKWIGLAWAVGALFLAFLFVGGLPILAGHIPMRLELDLKQIYGEPFAASDECQASPGAARALARLIERIYPQASDRQDYGISIKIVRRKEVNAIAYLGGEIFLFSGLLNQARSAEEVAGVLAHEIEHVQNRHIAQSLVSRALMSLLIQSISGGAGSGQVLQILLSMRFTRQQEEQADRLALDRLKRGQVDPKGFKEFFNRLETKSGSSLFSDHPGNASRVEMINKYGDFPTTPALRPKEWRDLQNYCGEASEIKFRRGAATAK